MAGDNTTAYARAKYQIFKYAEGQVPGVDEPFEIIEKEEEMTKEQYEDFIKNMGGAK